MKVITPEISWHGKEAIFSISIQPAVAKQPRRLATAGLDNNVRIWEYRNGEVRFLSNLSRHDRAVNIVRFSNKAGFLASAGDDGNIFIWKLSEKDEAPNIFEEGQNVETWCTVKTLRGHLEDVNDLCWSSDDQFLVSGSVDHTAILWDIEKGQKVTIFNDANHFVNGVTLDPLGQYLATMSCDRALRIYNLQTKKLVHCVSKMNQPCSSKDEKADEITQKMQRIFHDETVVRRRLSFTSDGKILLTPASCLQVEAKQKQTTQQINTVMIFGRHCLSKPVACLPNLSEPANIVACCPTLYKLRPQINGRESPFKLDYRSIFAIASCETVLLYDTQHIQPFAMISNIHYASITDLSWCPSGEFLTISSRDGFCSVVQFEGGELGEVYQAPSVTMTTAEEGKPPAPSVTMTTEGTQDVEVRSGTEEEVADKVDEMETEVENRPADVEIKEVNNGGKAEMTCDVEPKSRRVALTTIQQPEVTSQPRRIVLTPIVTE